MEYISNQSLATLQGYDLGYTTRKQYKTIVRNQKDRIYRLERDAGKAARKLDKIMIANRKKTRKTVENLEDQFRGDMRKMQKKIALYEVQISNDPKLQVNVVEYNKLKGERAVYDITITKMKRDIAKYKSKSSKYKKDRDKYRKKYEKLKKQLKGQVRIAEDTGAIPKDNTVLYAGLGIAALVGGLMIMKKPASARKGNKK